MAQYLPLPDGNSLLMKEGETPQEAWARAQQQFPDSFKAKEPEKKETTVGGQAKEFFKGLAPGAIGMVESAAIGASALLPEETEKAARAGIASLAGVAKKPFEAAPGYEETVGRKLGEASGSIIPFLGLGPLGAAGRIGMGALGAGAGAGEARTRAEAGGATEGQRSGATALGTVVGLSEMFAPARILGRVAEPVKEGAIAYVKRALIAGGEEAAQEAASQAAQNLISKGLYKPEQSIIEDVGESAAYGGAVGAMAQGLFDLALGRRAKGAGKPQQQQEEFAKLRAEEEQRLEAERQRKATPEYAQEVVQQYDALAKQKQDLIAQIKTVTKDSPTYDADKAFNTQINAQIKTLSKEIEPLAGDYYKAKTQVDAIAKQEELDKLPPQDFMLQQMGMEVKPVKAKKEAEPEIRRGKGQLFGDEIAPPPAADTSVQDYAKGQFDAARGAGVFDLGDIADYMMQDPVKAAEMVKTRTKMPDLTAAENNLLLSGIKLRLSDIEKKEKAATKQELAQRQETLKSQTLTQPEDQMALFKESQADVEEQARNAEPNFDYLDPMFEKALEGKTVIAVDPSVKPIARGPQVRERIDALIAEVDKADQDYRTARYAIPAQGKRGAPERAAAMEALTKGKTALAKIEQISKEGGAYAREVVAARRAQQEAMAKLSDITEQLRTEQTLGGANKEMAASTEQSLTNKAEQVRGQLISSALQEAALHRRAAGNPAISQDEAIKAASAMYDSINEWVERSKVKRTPVPQMGSATKPIREKVQRSGNTVSTYLVYDPETQEPVELTIIRQKGGNVFRVFSRYPGGGGSEFDASYGKGMTNEDIIQKSFLNTELFTLGKEAEQAAQPISPEETAQFQERIKEAMRNLFEKPEGKATRVETGPLKRQFKETEAQKVAEARGETATTLRGELARRTEFVRNKMAKMGGMRPGARDALNAAADLMDQGKATRDILDKVEPVVDAIVAGRDVKQVDIQAIKDAIRATEEVPQGQKSLFPEIQEDLGYIRATPKNFANSPRIKPVWTAIDRAREMLKKTEPVRLAKEATRKNRLKLLNQLEERMDSIRKDTQFFWKDTSRWSDAEMAKVFAGMPEAGTTQAEKDILYKYAKNQPMSQQEQVLADRLLKDFRAKELPKYQARVKEAMSLLAQGRRLQDADNQLLAFMQDTNENVRATAKALSERMAGMRDTIKYLKDVMRGSAILTPEQKALLDAEKAVEQQRGEYQKVVAEKFKVKRKDMEAARNALLDPQIGEVSKELEAAKKTLDKEKPLLEKEIARLQSHFDAINMLHEGAMRKRLARAKLSEMDEKKNILKDLTDKVKEQEDALEKLVTERHEDFDGAAVAIETMLDRDVKMERQYLEMQEATLAAMRGETVLDNPKAYPFAYQQAVKNLEVQKQTVKAAEKRVTEFKEVAKSEQQQMEDFWKDKLGGKGIKRQAGTTEELKTTAEKEADTLRKQEQDKADRAYEAEQTTLIKAAQVESIDKEVGELITELGAYEEFPNELSALKKLAQDETLPQAERDAALAKAGVIQNIESLEAQREVLLEGKPRKKQRAATVASTIALAAQKPLRTGYRKALESASEGLAAEREGGVYGEYGEEQLDLRGLFRTTGNGEGMTVDEVQKVADEVRKDWEVVPPVVVIQSETGLPIRIYKQLVAENMEGKAPGLYDPKTKKVYLIADNLHGSTDVALTVAHEIAGHFGLREMLGDTYAATMQSIYAGNEVVRTAADGKMDANKALTREVAVEEVLADLAETGPYANSPAANALRRIYSAIKQWFLTKLGIANVSDSEVKQLVADARRFVKTGKGARGGNVDTSGALYRTKATYNDEFANVGGVVEKVVAQNKTWWDTIKANTTGLAFETQLVDRFAGFERLAKYMEPLKGTQMLYYLRSYDQRMNIVSKAVSDGAPAIKEVTRDDGRIERLVETTGGANIAGVVNKLKDAKPYIGNGEAVNQVFTTYMAAIRAKNKGIETLNFGTDKDGKPVLTQAMLDEVTNLVNANPALKTIFEDARTEYNKYNRDLLDFVASTGALSKALVQKLVAEDDYIPFYRERKGVVELVIGNESPIRIGSIAEQPYLDKLVGGDTAILDFMTSSVQNTNMLMDMGLRNLATKNAVMELVDLKAATLVKKAEGPDVVKFKVEGDDRYAIIATEKVKIGNKEFETGVPADILVKGMEGIPTQMPFLFKVMSLPAQGLRKAVTLSPLYMAKQLFRDSLAAPILSGADFTPVVGALKQIGSPSKEALERRGITGGQQFKGTSEDLSKILRDITEGQSGWMQALGKFEAMGMEADALTRRAQYNSYIEQGMSEMEATLMSLESMNFNKRGASPSIHVANALIPFFNAQIQGLNVLYKAMSGKMPFNDQLRIREKLLMRGGMMAAATFAYAVMMEDDEAYKNATPDQKYGNWFVRLPGLDEPIKIPVPFEIGYIFKSIPEAMYNIMTTEHGGEEAVKAFKQILLQTVPGGSSYGIPQAAKPLIEVGLGKSFYTGRDILSAREKQLLPEEQYRTNTSDAAKLVGSTLGISPIKIEALVSGYTGTMGLAFLQAISLGVPAKETPEQAVKRLSEYPIVGGAFQPNDAGGIINSVYERMNDVVQVKATVDKLLEEGKVQEAQALMTKRGTEYMQAELANTFKTNMNVLTKAERAIAASDMKPEAKRKQLDEIRKMKIGLANATREISDRTILLVGGS